MLKVHATIETSFIQRYMALSKKNTSAPWEAHIEVIHLASEGYSARIAQ
jgi:hypothetical protein